MTYTCSDGRVLNMKTFETEYHDLILWYEEELNKTKDLNDEFDGHDGSEQGLAQRKIDHEYRTKLFALKDKCTITPEQRAIYKKILSEHEPYAPDDPEYLMFDGNKDIMRSAATVAKRALEEEPQIPDPRRL